MPDTTVVTEQDRAEVRRVWMLCSSLRDPIPVAAEELFAGMVARVRQDAQQQERERAASWGIPEGFNACLLCGSDKPCMKESDLKPGDPGIPCTFDKTYPELVALVKSAPERWQFENAKRELAGCRADTARLRECLSNMPVPFVAGQCWWCGVYFMSSGGVKYKDAQHSEMCMVNKIRDVLQPGAMQPATAASSSEEGSDD